MDMLLDVLRLQMDKVLLHILEQVGLIVFLLILVSPVLLKLVYGTIIGPDRYTMHLVGFFIVLGESMRTEPL